MIPRDYQRAAVDAAHDRTAEHGNTMLVLPTGAGKTAIAGFFVGEEAERQRILEANRKPFKEMEKKMDEWGL